jgi:trehalose/maltose hydrolase-like predicted phosphorylase
MSSRRVGSPGDGPIDDDGWSLSYEGFDPATEGLREALCTLGNGFFATRGAAPEARADDTHYPGTYVAGLYNRRVTQVAGHSVENESTVNVPNWLPMSFRIDESDWFDVSRTELLEFSQQLSLRQATLTRSLRMHDGLGRVIRVDQRRFVSMSDPHTACLETVLCAENWSGTLTIRSGIDGSISNSGVARYSQFDEHHLVDIRTQAVDGETIGLAAHTSQSSVCIAEVARTRAYRNGDLVDAPRQVIDEPGAIAQEFSVDIGPLETITIEKIVTLFTSRDRAISEPFTEALLRSTRSKTFSGHLDDHLREWDNLWRRFPLELEGGGPETQLTLRLHIFHLLQTVSRHTVDLDVGVPARGLHGEAYRGHIFWDELFILPYLYRHYPELGRSLLMYRYRRLPEARSAAIQAGFRGAMYPWQSGSNGREEAQLLHLNPLSGHWLPDASHLQRHVGVAIAYNIWQYFATTGDTEFMADHGAEMIFEISRFWASAAQFDDSLGRYVVRGVMGPDEYHDGYVGASAPGLKDNAYTNIMVVWVLCRALELIELLPEPQCRELFARLDLDDIELARWDDVSRRMRVAFHPDGVISQFEGYEELNELDWGVYRDRYGDISRLDRILEDELDTPNAYKASKQADVLMLLYLLPAAGLESILERLGYDPDPDCIAASVDYYLDRTSHGSTLSRVVHSWVLARRDPDRSWGLFQEALRSDREDIQGGTTREGVHLGAMIGTVDLVERGYLGIDISHDVIWFSPSLPAAVRSLVVDFCYRGRWMTVTVDHGVFTVVISDGGQGPIQIVLDGKAIELSPGVEHQLRL